jgi:surface protein
MNNKETKLHYKMYKDGKKWIFCGLATVGLITGMGVVDMHASADVNQSEMVKVSSVKDKSDTKTTTDSQVVDKDTELTTDKSNDVDNSTLVTQNKNTDSVHKENVETNTDVSSNENTASNTTKKNVDATENKDQTQAVTDKNDVDAKTDTNNTNDKNTTSDNLKQNSSTDAKDDTRSTTEKETSNVPDTNTVDENTDSTNSKNDISADNKKDTQTNNKNDAYAKPETNTNNDLADNTTNSESKSDIKPEDHQTANVDDSIDTDISNKDQDEVKDENLPNQSVNTDNTDKNQVDSQKKKNDYKKDDAKAADDIASGTFGTSDWYIDAQGTLHFGAGDFGVSQFDATSPDTLLVNKNAWGTYADQIKKISFDDKVKANRQSGGLFNGLTNLMSVENMQNFDTSDVAVMDVMFWGDKNLTSIDVSNWNISNVYSMYGTFYNCANVSTLNVSNWDVSKVGNMSYLFDGMTKLKALDVSNWDTSNVTSMFYTFAGNELVSTLDVSNWNVSKVQDFRGTFSGMKGLKTLDVSNWNTSSATSMDSLFQGTSSLGNLDVSNFDVSHVTSMTFTFLGTGVKTLDVSKWDVSKVTNFKGTFEGVHLNGLDVSNWKTTSAKETDWMFAGSYGTLNISNFNTDNVTDMNHMFSGIDVKNLDLSSFNTANATNMEGMFTGAKNIYKLDISNFDMSKVTNEKGMLSGMKALRVLVLGDKTVISTSELSELDVPGTSNRWVAVNGGTEDNPQGDKYYTSSELTGIYEGSMADTYVIGEDKSSIAGHDSTIIAGPNSQWNPSDNFDNATGIDGSPLDFSKVIVTGTVDPTTPGDYEITYSYIDEVGKTVSDTVTVHVVASQVSVDGHDSTIIAGPNSKWSASDNFDGATDADGNPIDLKDVTVSGKVNPQVAGDYQVTYSYKDAYGNTASKTVTVHVVASQVSVDGHDSTIIAGPNSKWSASDNFDGATDADGNPIDLKDVTVSGTVNPQVAGDYQVTYSYKDAYGNTASKTVTVHVVASQVSVDGHDSTIIAGPNSKWSASDNFDGATDADGNPIDLKDVTVSGTVNPQVAGDYQVTYSYKDAYGNTASKTVTVHVVASQVSVDGHDSTIIAGPNSKWSASDNFDGATDADGNPIDLKDVTVSGTVNPQVAGDYQVTYSYKDAYGNTASKTVTVHVVASQVSVDGHDSTIIAGPNSKWSASDNFDGATDADGNPIDLKDVTVSGIKVNPQVAGDYQVTYSYKDAYGNTASKTVTVHVVASQVSVDGGHDSTVSLRDQIVSGVRVITSMGRVITSMGPRMPTATQSTSKM